MNEEFAYSPNKALAAGISPLAPKLRAFVLDAQRLMRDLLCNALAQVSDIEAAEQFDTADELRPRLQQVEPDVIIAGLSAGNACEMFDFAHETMRAHPSVSLMLISRLHDTSLLIDAMEAGVSAFLFAEDIGLPGLVTAVRAMRSGYRIFPDEEACRHINPYHGVFSRREIAVLRLLCCGMDREDIARILHVSVSTVKNVISALLAKTEMDSAYHLALHLTSLNVLTPLHTAESA